MLNLSTYFRTRHEQGILNIEYRTTLERALAQLLKFKFNVNPRFMKLRAGSDDDGMAPGFQPE